jgi:hypothetical protein
VRAGPFERRSPPPSQGLGLAHLALLPEQRRVFFVWILTDYFYFLFFEIQKQKGNLPTEENLRNN